MDDDVTTRMQERADARGWVFAPTLWQLIEARAAATPDAVLAHEDTGDELTFAGYRDACLRAAAGLFSECGVTVDTSVSWELPTWNESLVLVGALARLGARQNPLIPIYRNREVGFITEQSGASLLVVPTVYRGFDFAAMAEEIAASRPGLSVLVVDRDLPDGDPAVLPPFQPAPASAADAPVRWLFYTSGTTADPKGAPHTDLTVMASALAMAECLDIRHDDVSALVFPFTHIGGIGWLLASLMTGCTLLTTEAFNPTDTPAFLADNDVTLAGSGTPFHMAYLAAQRASNEGTDEAGGEAQPIFPNVRSYPGGGAPKPPQLHHDLKREIGGVGIVSGYGLTEAPIVVMASTEDPDQKLADTEGRPTPGVELIVVALDGTRAGPGVEGEIRLKGPQVIRGYLDPALDADAFDDQGFFRSGDLGIVDDEGYVTITGRLKDVIIRHGENISAKEVEDLLYAHPAVADVAVIGLPDPRTGERACAVVAVTEGESFDAAAMGEYLRTQGLRVNAIPEQLELVEVVPRNPAGKILKHTLRERFAPAGTSPNSEGKP
ncbi:MAG: AMP-binding protein [Acidimicrobiales bacterium]|jgi:acyl-CoA synthetase (AMP-forming)/AMP-acid ligase II